MVWFRRMIGASLVAMTLPAVIATSAHAVGEGSIDHAEVKDGQIRVLYSLPDLPAGTTPDVESVRLSIDGRDIAGSAELAATANSTERVRRTTVLTIDTSNSMRGARFQAAKTAAQAFLASAPEDLYIGIVTFAGSVDVVQPPTLDRDAAASVIETLTLTRQTRLYDGVLAAVEAAGAEGQRSLLVLSDGRDTNSAAPLPSVVEAIDEAGVRVDAVSLDAAAGTNAPLETMVAEGDGTVVAAAKPEALTGLFSDEAVALAKQLLVTAELPAATTAKEGSLAVSVDAGGETYSDTAFVVLAAGEESVQATADQGPIPVQPPRFSVSGDLMVGGLVAASLAVFLLAVAALGVFGPRKDEVDEHIAAYTRAGVARAARTRTSQAHTGGDTKSVKSSAVQAAQRALDGNRGLEAALGARLDAAGMALRPAEWLLLHAGIAIGLAVLAFLLSSGSIVAALLLMVAGAVVPWFYLRRRRSRRLKAFDGQLAETLQLIAGSLSAGLSLAQGIDTVVREGTEPVASEFRRALVQARLGVAIEDALDEVAERMQSDDFHWVVMAVRIQRDVGGNLAELLLTVAKTLREREYLRRQVKTLSAEGRMSAWILGGLPPGFMVYLTLVNPDYMTPMLTNPIGWVLLGAMVLLLTLGVFWMSRIVKVEV